MKKILCIGILLSAALAAGEGSLWAGNGASGETASRLLAVGQWISGTVEDIESDGNYRYITLDGVRYRTMPQVTVEKQVASSNGAYNEVPGTLRDVRRNQSVALKVQGFRIYRIMVLA